MNAAAGAVTRARADLIRLVSRLGGAADVFAEASRRLRRLVQFDAAAWLTTDPVTGLPTAPVRADGVDGLGPDRCAEHWRREFLVPDVNLFRELARARVPAGGLHAAAGDPTRSPRYRDFLRPLGFEDELRAVLRAGDAPWGSITLWRCHGREPFTRREIRLVASLSDPIGAALRRHVRRVPLANGYAVPRPPGVLTFDLAGQVTSINDQAGAWLAELPAGPALPTDLGIEVPVWMTVTVLRAAAVRHGAGDGTARTRVRSRRGQWLACHATCLRGTGGGVDQTVVMLDAADPAELAPIIAEAYDLTDREQQIVRMIARGVGTAGIAQRLYLSPHTVRDYVKTILHKVGVSSRGELVASLYAGFYGTPHTGDAP
ncbi:MAG TPA: LuxR C-terminal-related transcriptional regulator [Natronosporangium sp.]|nr:LuxR C-terminal-related transcriptional regulator [Natronosporangium sp.]